MKLRFTEGGQVQQWDVDFDRFLSCEAEAIEKVTGLGFMKEFPAALDRGSVLAMRALLWVLQKRAHPTLKWADVQFTLDQLDVQPDRDELIRARENALVDEEMPAAQREAYLAAIDERLAALDDEPDGVESGKATSPAAAGDTK